jgi:hypothetical protein
MKFKVVENKYDTAVKYRGMVRPIQRIVIDGVKKSAAQKIADKLNEAEDFAALDVIKTYYVAEA